MANVNEKVIESMGLQVAQLTIDKAFMVARLEQITEAVQAVFMTTNWTEDDNGIKTPVVAAEPLMRLHSLVLVQPAPESYAPGDPRQATPVPPA